MDYIAEAHVIREDPRWDSLTTWSALYRDMTAKYGKADAREVWNAACNMGAKDA